MVVFLENGSDDCFRWMAFENHDVAEHYIAISDELGIGTAYPDCGWAICKPKVYDNLDLKIVTEEMLHKLEKVISELNDDAAEEMFMNFEMEMSVEED